MNHPDYDYMLVMERRRDELAAAEKSRLFKKARLALRASGGTRPSRARRALDTLSLAAARLLARVGEGLLNLSCRLQTRVEMLNAGVGEHDPQPSPCS